MGGMTRLFAMRPSTGSGGSSRAPGGRPPGTPFSFQGWTRAPGILSAFAIVAGPPTTRSGHAVPRSTDVADYTSPDFLQLDETQFSDEEIAVRESVRAWVTKEFMPRIQ